MDVDPEVYLYLINASFSAVSSRGETMSYFDPGIRSLMASLQ